MNTLHLTLTALLAGAVYAQQGDLVQLVSRTPGEARHAAFLGTQHAITAEEGVLRVWQIEDPTLPQLAGELVFSGLAMDLEVAGSLAYLATGSNGVLVVDLANPEQPTVLHHLELPHFGYGIDLHGDLLAISQRNLPLRSNGLLVADLAEEPSFVSELDPVCYYGDGVHWAPDGDIAYLTGWAECVPVNLSNLDQPTEYPALPDEDVTLIADMVFLPRAEGEPLLGLIARGDDGLSCFGFDTPSAPQLLSHLDPPHVSQGLHVDGALALSAGNGLQMYDISAAPMIQHLGGLQVPGVWNPVGLAVQDSMALLPARSTTHLVDFRNLAEPAILAELGGNHPEYGRTASKAGLLAIVENNSWLAVLMPGNEGSLEAVGRLELGGTVLDLDLSVDGSRAVALDQGQTLHVIDLSNPESPLLSGSLMLPLPCGTVALAPDGTWAVVGTHTAGSQQLYRIDLSDPQEPTVVVTHPLGWTVVEALDIDASMVAAGGNNHLILWDHQAGGFDWLAQMDVDSEMSDLEFWGNRLAASATETGLWVWDLQEPNAPELLSRYQPVGPSGELEIMGDFIWLINDYAPIVQEDPRLLLLDPAGDTAQELAWWRLDGGILHLATVGSRVLLSQGNGGGLQLLEADESFTRTAPRPVQSPRGFALLEAAPNPFNPSTMLSFQLERPGQARLELFDMMGRRVRLLSEGTMAAGLHTQRLEAGELASGVYVLRLEADGQSQSRRLLLLK
jgi:hypothetical protein